MEPTTIKLEYDHTGQIKHPDFCSPCVPSKGDILRISSVRYVVIEREFWLENGLLDCVELHLQPEVD